MFWPLSIVPMLTCLQTGRQVSTAVFFGTTRFRSQVQQIWEHELVKKHNFPRKTAIRSRKWKIFIIFVTLIFIHMEDVNRIKVVLVEKKRTSKWLAEQLGVNPSTVSKWCTNSSQPDLACILKIADLLEVDLKELFVREYKQYLLSQEIARTNEVG